MTVPTWLLDGSHVLIAGVTGSGAEYGGKTATAHWWADRAIRSGEYRFALAFDPKGRQYHEGTHVAGPREAADAIRDGDRFLDWEPWRSTIVEDHAAALSFARGLSGDTIMIHDDAIMYAEADSLVEATALSGNPGPGKPRIKSLVVSQDPWDLPRRGVRANLTVLVWVGPVTETAYGYLRQTRGEGVADRVRDRHEGQPHVWSAIDGDDVRTIAAVPERYA